MSIDVTVFNHAVKSRKNRARANILVVEDDPFSRQLIMATLKEYETSNAGDGKEAMKAYALYAPDIVFLDIEMPGINGLDVLKEIIKVDANAFVVMLTSHTDAAIVKQSVAEGAKGYIAKPFSKEKIFQYINLFAKKGKSS